MTTITAAAVTADLTAAAARVRAVGDALNASFVERRREIDLILTALVAGEHVLLLGDPGTGKSALTQAVCRAIGGSFFQLLMTRFTLPEEVFGPVSLTGIERDEYRRVTAGYAADASVVFLDEVFKANSAILNSLLTLLNEREFDNGGVRLRAPLDIAIGASNELPDDETLAALFDRFVLRSWVAPIKNRDALRRLLRSTSEPAINVSIDAADLAVLRGAVSSVTIPDDVLDTLLDLRDALAQDHGITASDRRWRKCAKIVRAAAALAGRTVATRDDLLILASALWRAPDEAAKVAGTIARLACPELAEAMRLHDAAVEIVGALNLNDAKTSVERVATANAEIKKITDELRRLPQSPGVADLLANVETARQKLAAHIADRIGFARR